MKKEVHRLWIDLPPDLYTQVEEQAEANDRSVNRQVVHIVRISLKRQQAEQANKKEEQAS